MKSVGIRLNTIEKIKDFVEQINKIEGEYDLRDVRGKYCIDAKSIMGIFSLDLHELLVLSCADQTQDLPEGILHLTKHYKG